MTKAELESLHLSELHALAAEAGVEGFRKLRREELLDRLNDGGDGDSSGSESERGSEREGGRRPRRERSSRSRERTSRSGGERNGGERNGRDDEGRRGRREEGRSRDRGRTSNEAPEEDAVELTIRGPLEISESGDGVVYGEQGEKAQVTAAQIRRCELREGDLVEGPAKNSRRSDRRLSLVRVEKVNGAEPVENRGPQFESLTAVTPSRPVALKLEADDVLTPAVDLLAPLTHGQRVLITAERHPGRSHLLRGLAKATLTAEDSTSVVALLVDERPEVVSEWRAAVEGAEIVDAGADLRGADQLRRARLALAAAKRRAEAGEDIVLLIDSLSRLAVATGDASETKPFFGAGRDLAEDGSGSLTVIATVFKDDDAVLRSLATTESASLELSSELAEQIAGSAVEAGNQANGAGEALGADQP